MAGNNQIPEKLINYAVYGEGNQLLGIADVTLPKLQSMTETIKGSGIAGEIDSPVLGHFSSLTLSLTWRTLVKNVVKFAKQKVVQLDLRAASQNFNSAEGDYKVSPCKVVVNVIPKSIELGKLDVGVSSGTTSEFEVIHIKISVDDEEILEVDKYNFICKIDGEDYLSDVKSALGK